MGRFAQWRAGVRQAVEARRESIRAAQASASAQQATEYAILARGESALAQARADENGQTTIEVVGRDDSEVPHGLRIAAGWAWRLLVLILATAVLLYLVARLQLVVIPLAISLLLSALLAPFVDSLRRMGVQRSLATAIALVTGIAAVAGVLTMVITQFINGFPKLSENTAQAISRIQTWLQTGFLHLTDQQLNSFFDEVQKWLTNNKDTLTSGALSTATTILHVLTGVFLVLFSTFFFMRDGRSITGFLIGLLPSRAREPMAHAADESWRTLVSYVRATVLVAFIDAVGIGLALVILRVDFWLPLAALVFLGSFIPVIGATISGAVASLVALVTNGWVTALLVLGSVILVQQLEGHVLQPLIMGRAVSIHPLAVIVAIAMGGVVAGIIGALVAVPLVAVLNTAVRVLAAHRHGAQGGMAHDRADPGDDGLAVPPPASPEGPAKGAREAAAEAADAAADATRSARDPERPSR
ncbi:AI-2E family transporter [Luedemannella helvata]|uniref:AI-2E family transporter n=1 Tax=Luedemannella helvata TaxID=349315 RepID=A0ABP4WVS3_9ACTN